MRKLVNTGLLVFTICICSVITGQTLESDCTKEVKDKRGIMKPRQKGAWETGKYRNVFLNAGYKKADINAKLAKAYYDVFEGPNRVYFEVGDSMAYVSDLKNHDVCTE